MKSQVGEIGEVVHGGEYVVIRRFPFVKLAVPVKAMEWAGGRLTIAQALMYLDMAPNPGKEARTVE